MLLRSNWLNKLMLHLFFHPNVHVHVQHDSLNSRQKYMLFLDPIQQPCNWFTHSELSKSLQISQFLGNEQCTWSRGESVLPSITWWRTIHTQHDYYIYKYGMDMSSLKTSICAQLHTWWFRKATICFKLFDKLATHSNGLNYQRYCKSHSF